MHSEKVSALVDNLKLNTYLFIEKLVQDRLAGKKDPWPGRLKGSSMVAAALGLSLFAFTGLPALIQSLKPDIDPCLDPLKYSDTFGGQSRRSISAIEIPVVSAAPELGGGGGGEGIVLSGYNTRALGYNVGIYSQTDVSFLLYPGVIREAMNPITVGTVIPDNIQLLFSFANASFKDREYGMAFTEGSKNHVVGQLMPEMRYLGFIPETDNRYIFGVVPLYDVYRETITQNPKIDNLNDFKIALSRQIMSEMRSITAAALQEYGFINNTPKETAEIRKSYASGAVNISFLPVNFVDLACQASGRGLSRG